MFRVFFLLGFKYELSKCLKFNQNKIKIFNWAKEEEWGDQIRTHIDISLIFLLVMC